MLRRKFIIAAGLAGLALTGYSGYRGVRFPRLSFEPMALPSQFAFEGVSATTSDLILTPSDTTTGPRFRAYAPEPQLSLSAERSTELKLTINNISSDAELIVSGGRLLEETTNGITRHLRLSLEKAGKVVLRWQLPKLATYSFAAIGDTGGDQELAWCIQRAHQLGARFMLHLGDFNYQAGDYQRSIDLFDQAPLPIYVSIGNHDFHDNGLLHSEFRRNIGPLNHAFAIGKTRFANLDTAASMLPYGAGHRGALLKSMRNTRQDFADTVAFTHRPLVDPSDDSTHDIGSVGERDWLIESLKQAGATTLLSGHIHIYNRVSYDGIENFIVGQGLGHQDLIVNRDYSKILIGEVDTDGRVSYHPEPLAMPMNLHCHPRSDVVKQSLVAAEHYPAIEAIQRACKTSI